MQHKPEIKQIDTKELNTAIKKLKRKKSTGPDNIPNEAFIEADQETRTIYQATLNKITKTETIPQEWQEGEIITMYKGKGIKGKCPATGAATFPAQHTTIGIDIRSSCCSFLATQTMVCSKMKDKIWQKARDKKHFIRDEIYWWQRERTLMGHAHIVWVLLSAARIAVRALNCITYHVAEPVGVWNGLCAPASKPSNLLNSCVFILDAL